MNFYVVANIDLFSAESIAGYIATAITTLIGFFLTVFILKKILYRPLLKVMDQRKREVEVAFEEIEEGKEENARIARENQDKALAMRQEAAEVLSMARTQAENQAESILEEARNKSSVLIEKTQRDLARMKEQEEELVYKKAVDLALVAVGHFASNQFNTEEALGSVRETVKDLVSAGQRAAKADLSTPPAQMLHRPQSAANLSVPYEDRGSKSFHSSLEEEQA